jgi:hypothetical protein
MGGHDHYGVAPTAAPSLAIACASSVRERTPSLR